MTTWRAGERADERGGEQGDAAMSAVASTGVRR
jgi:hypothetical protein